MYLLIHLKTDGSVTWTSTPTPYVPSELLAPGELGVVLHPLDVKTGPQAEPEGDSNES